MELKILAINSLPAYGNAGLKCILSVLGTKIVPVPSLVLSGIGNVPGFKKYEYDFENNLHSTFKHLSDHEDNVILYIGYLGHYNQIDIIHAFLSQFSPYFKSIIIDPVSGDNDKAYVNPDLVNGWHKLLPFANWATPNITEVKLLTRHTNPDLGIQMLQEKYPSTEWIITSYGYPTGEIGNRYVGRQEVIDFSHQLIPQKVSGAGDVFTSYFITEYFINEKSIAGALQDASKATLAFIQNNLLTF